MNPQLVKFLKKLFTRQTSNFYVIFGRRGTGKTDFALLIDEILNSEGIIKESATNTKVFSSPFPIKEITNLEDLTYWAQNTRGHKLFIFDEIAKAWNRRRPMSKLSVELIQSFQILRKYKLSVLASTIDQKYVDNVALGDEILDGFFTKPWFPKRNKQKYKIAYYQDKLKPRQIRIKNIPRTSVKFDSWDSSPFTEKPLINKRAFKDNDMKLIYEWAVENRTSKELGLHSMQLNRKVKKIMRYFYDNMPHEPHT